MSQLLINYRTIQDLSRTIYTHLKKIPSGVEVVAGIHRSGQLAANIIGAYLNLPVISFRNLCETYWVYAGHRSYIDPELQDEYLRKSRTVLVVEDATTSGATLMQEKGRYQANIDRAARHRLIYLTIYPASKHIEGVDMFFEVVPPPRFFEWNWLNHSIMSEACVDFDGVLCHDPEQPERDDDTGLIAFRKFIETAKPLHIPARRIGHVVTSRLERWRHLTERWMKKHGITCRSLMMMPCQSSAERSRYGPAKYKAEVYQHYRDAPVFFESCPKQSKQIFEMTGRPVYCVGARRLLQKGG